MSGLPSRVALLLVVIFCCAQPVHAQTCGGNTPGIYNETFDIEKSVDASRYVQRAVFTNNARGDYTVEFTATLAAGRERWTLTFEKDPNFKMIQHVDVDGVRRYSVKAADVGGTYNRTLETPSVSSTIAVTPTLGDTTAFEAIASSTAADRAIVKEVLAAIQAQQAPNPALQNCVALCGPALTPCSVLVPCGDYQCCYDWFVCCRDWADHVECHGNCYCSFLPPTGVEDCCTLLGATMQVLRQSCMDNLIDCLLTV